MGIHLNTLDILVIVQGVPWLEHIREEKAGIPDKFHYELWLGLLLERILTESWDPVLLGEE